MQGVLTWIRAPDKHAILIEVYIYVLQRQYDISICPAHVKHVNI